MTPKVNHGIKLYHRLCGVGCMSNPANIPILKLQDDGIIVWDYTVASILYNKGFFGKPLGLRKVKPGSIQRPSVLSFFEGLYLLTHNIIEVELDGDRINQEKFIEFASAKYEDFIVKYKVYCNFRKLGYVVRPGMKFGADFVIYVRGPGFDHSKWVVHIERDEIILRAIAVVRAGRLAASVKKKYLISVSGEDKNPNFYSFERLKI